MGGGDLNSKKSWHPNTMKNQERVWKAEQAAAEEKKRMLELQRERAEERDRAELNTLMKHSSSSIPANESRLSWMYDKPDKKVEQEAYLLGKSLDKNAKEPDKLEQDVIPAVSRRVVGSSMLTAAGDAQVDMSRKIREDPLLLIKERERAARAALLNNPLQRRKLAELLRKEQDLRKESKAKKTTKKKDKNLDDLLAAKLNALGGQKGIDLASLLNSDDSSSDSSSGGKKSSKKKRKKEKRAKEKKHKKERKHSSGSDSEDEQCKRKEYGLEDRKTSKKSEHSSTLNKKSDSKKRKSQNEYSDSEIITKKHKNDNPERHANEREYEVDNKYSRDYDNKSDHSRHRSGKPHERHEDRRKYGADQEESRKRGGMSEEEKAARLAEMAAAGAQREIERGRRVAEQRAAESRDDTTRPPRARHDARALPDSLESRIHSNRHYIQRDKRHMNEHFARR